MSSSDVSPGYADDRPVSSTLDVYNPASSTFVSAYTPPPAGSMPTQTIPPVTPHSTTLSTNQPGSDPTPSPSFSTTNSGNSNATAIAIGSVFGILGLLVLGIGTTYYVRRRRQMDREREFMALSDDDGDIIGETHQVARSIPIVKMHNAPPHGILGSLGAVLKVRSARNMAPRKDMFADEDGRSFGEWYNRQRSVAGSTWSLKSILGNGIRTRSRQASGTSFSASPLGEKDPFADPDSIVRDERTGLISLTARMPSRRSRQETSYQSWRSESSYRDPFSDPIYDDVGDFDSADLYRNYGPAASSSETLERRTTRLSSRPSLPHLQSVLPVSEGGHLLSPLSEHTSQTTLPSQKTSNSSQGHSTSDPALNPVDSASSSPSVPPKPASILSKSNSSLLSGGSQPIRRSDSWWSRFARANLLASGASRKMTYDIRDPNPPPKLGAIEEAVSPQGSPLDAADKEQSSQPLTTLRPIVYPPSGRHTHSPGQTDAGPSRAIPTRIYGFDAHGKSLSSLRTADSEAIERMAGTMDVVHYMKSRSHSGYRNSASGLSVETFSSTEVDTPQPDDDNLIMFASPLEMEPTSPTFRHPLAADQGDDPTLPHAVDAALPAIESKMPKTPPSSGNVVDKVKDYERRMSMEVPVSLATSNTTYREERTNKRVEMKYVLAPKPSLFVANPDRSASTDS